MTHKPSHRYLACIFIFLTSLISAHAQSIVRWRSSSESDRWHDRGEINLTAKTVFDTSTIEIDTAVRYQIIDGFGGCFNELGWRALGVLDSERIDEVIGALFDQVNGCRFNICRMPIGANDYATSWYSLDDSADDYRMEHFSIDRDCQTLIRYIKRAMRYNPSLLIWGSPWSPPAWMKENNNYSGGANTLRWNDQVLGALALYFVKYIRAYRSEGINVYAVHVQNEPYADNNYPTCLWSGAQLRDFIRDYLGPTFHDQRIDAEIWLGTINNDSYEAYAGTILSDTAACAFITGVGYQWAGKGAIGQTYKNHPEKKLMMTEQECGNGDNSWEYGEEVFNSLLFYFNNGAQSQMQWNMVLDETGMSAWNWKQNSMISVDKNSRDVTYNPQFYIVKHFSRFVDSGAFRIASNGSWNEKIAFLNPDGSVVVIVANMTSDERDAVISFGEKMISARLPAHSCNTFTLKSNTADGHISCAPQKAFPLTIEHGTVLNFYQSDPGRVSISLFNAFGRKMVTFSPQGNNSGAHRIELNPRHILAPGMYIVHVAINGRALWRRRFIAV